MGSSLWLEILLRRLPSRMRKLRIVLRQHGIKLTLVLSFFARIDTKLSVVLGLDLGMLTLLATKAPTLEKFNAFQTASTSICLIPIALSLYHLHQGSFPHLRGGTNSMVYFRTIAGKAEGDFVSGLPRNELGGDCR